MSHLVLLGDSTFDNAAYVPDCPPVIEQLRGSLPTGWEATLIAVDGHTTADVASQMSRVPPGATHIIVSVGGNDALYCAQLLHEPAATVGRALAVLGEVLAQFRDGYAAMLRAVLGLGKPICLCTIYDAIPTLGAAERAALAGFNDVITRSSAAVGIPILDLRLICDHPDDYSRVSPIEPSARGGEKITKAICKMVSAHDFAARRTIVYT